MTEATKQLVRRIEGEANVQSIACAAGGVEMKSAILALTTLTVIGMSCGLLAAEDQIPKKEKSRIEQLRALISQRDHKKAVPLAREIIAEKARQLATNPMDPETTAAIRAMRSARRLDSAVERLEAALGKAPDDVAILAQLQIYYHSTAQHGKLLPVSERLLAKYPDNMWFRYVRAATLAVNGRAREAMPELDRILREAPWAVETGGGLIQAYEQTNQGDRLVDLILATDPERRLSPTQREASYNWVDRVGYSLSRTAPRAALRLFRQLRTEEKQPSKQRRHTQSILGLLIQLGRADDLLRELSDLRSGKSTERLSDAAARREYLGELAAFLFLPTSDRDRDSLLFSAPPYCSPASAMLDVLAATEKLADLTQILDEGKADPDWEQTLGQGLRVLAQLREKHPRTQPIERFVSGHEQGRKGKRDVAAWIRAFEYCFVWEASRHDELLSAAARMAVLAFREWQSKANPYRRGYDRFLNALKLLDVMARAETAAGNAGKARDHYRKLFGLSSKVPGQRGGPMWPRGFDSADYQAKMPYLEQAKLAGLWGVAVDFLLQYRHRLNSSAYFLSAIAGMQVEWELTDTLAEAHRQGRLKALISQAEQELSKKPGDVLVIQRLTRLYRAAGQKGKAQELEERLAGAQGLSDEEALSVASELYRSGERDRAGEILLSLIRRGKARLLSRTWPYRLWYCRPENAERVAKAIEEMPPSAKGHYSWSSSLADNIERHAQGRPLDERQRLYESILRIYRAGEPFLKPGDSRDRYASTRVSGHVTRVIRALKQLGRHEDGYQYATQSIFGPEGDRLVKPNLAALFVPPKGLASSAKPCLATELIWLAKRTERLTELRQKLKEHATAGAEARRTARRMLTIMALLSDNEVEAKSLLNEILAESMPAGPTGFDPSLPYLARWAQERPELRPLAIQLQTRYYEGPLLERMGRERHAQIQGPKLVRAYLRAGMTPEALPIIRGLPSQVDRYYRYPERTRKEQALHLRAAQLCTMAGLSREAVAAYREVLRYPLEKPGNIHRRGHGYSFTRPSEALIRLMVRMRDDGQLASLMAELSAEWKTERKLAVGTRDVQPLTLLAAGHALAGRYEAARSALEQLDAADYPSTFPVLLNAVAASPAPRQALPLIDYGFTRWPYLFARVGDKVAILYATHGRALPLGEGLAQFVQNLPKASLRTPRGRDRIVPRQGPPPATEQREFVHKTLGAIAAVLYRVPGNADYVRIGVFADRDLGWPSAATRTYAAYLTYPWLAELSQAEPEEGYEVLTRLLGLSSATGGSTGARRLSLEDCFRDVEGAPRVHQTSVNRMISRLSNRKWNSFFVA